MKHINIVLAACFAGVVCGGGAVAAQEEGVGGRPAPSVEARFVPDSMLIGDQVQLQLDIDKDVAQEIHLPEFQNGQLTPQIEVLGIDGVDTLGVEGRRVRLRVRYRLTSFQAGMHPVVGFPVLWTQAGVAPGAEVKPDTILSQEVMVLRVNTFEIDTTRQTPFDIRRPLNTPLVFAEVREFVWWGLAVIVILAAGVYVIIRQVQRRRGRVRPGVVLPAHVVAIRALEKLHSKKLWQNGKHKEYYSTLTDIVRTYIERRYGVGAMEMTSDQILEAMGAVNDERLRAKLGELFSLADLVKFAKLSPGPEDNEQAYFDAYFYVEETKETEVLDEQA